MSKWAELTAMRVTTFSLTSLCRKAFLWQRRKRYLCEHRNPLYTALLFSGKLYTHLADIDHQAQEMFSQLIEQMATREEITEQLKEENQIVGRKDEQHPQSSGRNYFQRVHILLGFYGKHKTGAWNVLFQAPVVAADYIFFVQFPLV